MISKLAILATILVLSASMPSAWAEDIRRQEIVLEEGQQIILNDGEHPPKIINGVHNQKIRITLTTRRLGGQRFVRKPEFVRNLQTVQIRMEILQVPEKALQELLTEMGQEQRAEPWKLKDLKDRSAVEISERDAERFWTSCRAIKGVDIVGRPQVSTLDGQPAGIEVGSVPHEGGPELPERVRVRDGFQFKATPEITPQNRVRMASHFESFRAGRSVFKFDDKAFFNRGQARVVLLNRDGDLREVVIMRVAF